MGGARTGLVALATAVLLAVPAQAAEWQTQELEPGHGPADLAIDARGNALAVWTTDLTGSPVQVSFRPAGGHFGAPRTLDGCGGVLPGVDVDADGNFTVLWVSCNGTVQAATGTSDRGLETPVTLAPAPSANEWRAYPDLDVAPSGAAVAAWQTRTKDDSGHYKSRAEAALRKPGGSWDTPKTITPGPLAPWTLSMSDNIDVGIDSGGGAVVLFRRWHLDKEPGWADPEQMFLEPNHKTDQVVVGRPGEGFEEPRTIADRELESVRLAVGSGGQTLISWIVHGTSQAIGVIAGTTADPLAGDPYEAFRWPDQNNDDPVPHVDGAGRAYIVFGREGTALIEAPDVAGPWDAPQSVSSAEWPSRFNSAVSEAGEIVVAAYAEEASKCLSPPRGRERLSSLAVL